MGSTAKSTEAQTLSCNFWMLEIDGCQKELFLAAEIAIESPLAYLKLIGKELGVGVGIAVKGKQIDCRGQDLIAAAAQGCLAGD